MVISYTSHGPEQVRIFAFVDDEYLSLWTNNLYFEYLVCSQAITRAKHRVTAASQIPAYADAGAATSNYCSIMLIEEAVHIPHLTPRADGYCATFHFDAATTGPE